jgi:hypothetical protein
MSRRRSDRASIGGREMALRVFTGPREMTPTRSA